MPSRRIVAHLTLLAALAIGCRRGPPLPSGDVLASLATAEVAGGAFDPAAMKGKPTLVLFMTPTCSHCLATLPRAMAATSAKNANMVAVFVAGKAPNARGVIDHARYTGPALVDNGALRRKYGIESVPFTLVVGSDGWAVDAYEGEQDESTLADALASAR